MSDDRQITLVTGATGFIGRRLCERLQKEGEWVRACGRNKGNGPWKEFVEIDLACELQDSGLFEHVTTVFHLASKAHAVDDISDPADGYHEVIVEGTRRTLNKALESGVRNFVYISSVKAMGEGNPEHLSLRSIDETWPLNPQSPYGCAKAEAEALVRAAGFEHYVILRPVMVFGPGQKGNLDRMINAIMRGKFPPLPENGNKRSLIHIDDLVEFAIRSVQFPIADKKTYLLASAEPVSTRGLYNSIRQALDLPEQHWSIPMFLLQTAATLGTYCENLTGRRLPLDRAILGKLTGSAWYNSQLAQKELDYRPRHEVCDWLQDWLSPDSVE